jgi:YidC/Oxa1 family membrane protein insertase
VSFLFISRSLFNQPPSDSDESIRETVQSVEATAETAQTSNRTSECDFVCIGMKASKDVVPLGQIVEYTIAITNNSSKSINPTLTDALPEELALQTASISATVGSPSAQNNVLSWFGSLEPGDKATIFFKAIPPTISPSRLALNQAVQTLENVAILEVGQDTLAASTVVTTKRSLWKTFVSYLGLALVLLNEGISKLNIPYSFGFAIIVFTLVIKGLTYPLNLQQMRSTRATQELQPKLKELQKKYANDREKLSQAQMELYKEAGVNPLGGCLPMLIQMPVWFALYQALYDLAGTFPALHEGFFWIPSLAGPVTNRSDGISWLWPFVDGAPPLGWANAIGYLVLPVLLVVSQLYMQRMMTPQSDDPQQKAMGQAMMFMPFMFGYFALVVPSGLSLYWFVNNILSLVQQYFVNRTKEREEEQKASQSKQTKAKETTGALTTEPLKVAVEGGTDTNGQVKTDEKSKPKSRRSRSRSKRKRKKQR